MAENRTKIADINDPPMRTGELSEEDVAKISGGQREITKVDSNNPDHTQTIIDTIDGNNRRHDDLLDKD